MNDRDRCPICEDPLNPAVFPHDPSRLIASFSCRRCGDYRITLQALHCVPGDPRERAVLSYAVRQMPSAPDGSPPLLLEKVVGRIVQEAALPAPAEMADNLVQWLGDHTTPGEYVMIAPRDHLAIIGALDGGGIVFVLDFLCDNGLLRVGERSTGQAGGKVALSMQGWQRYDDLRRPHIESRVAFMAMPFGVAELDDVYRTFWKRAVEQAGFSLKRLDDNPPAGSIDNRLRVELRRSRFAVCELTSDNSGVYFEAGFMEALGRPVFYTCRRGEAPHFDTRQQQIVFWEPGAVDDAADRLRDSIRATIPDAANLAD